VAQSGHRTSLRQGKSVRIPWLSAIICFCQDHRWGPMHDPEPDVHGGRAWHECERCHTTEEF